LAAASRGRDARGRGTASPRRLPPRRAIHQRARPHALFGRSGAGKTSLVNIIAGLERPERGRVVVDGSVLVDTGSGIFVPKHRRRIGYVFQEDGSSRI